MKRLVWLLCVIFMHQAGLEAMDCCLSTKKHNAQVAPAITIPPQITIIGIPGAEKDEALDTNQIEPFTKKVFSQLMRDGWQEDQQYFLARGTTFHAPTRETSVNYYDAKNLEKSKEKVDPKSGLGLQGVAYFKVMQDTAQANYVESIDDVSQEQELGKCAYCACASCFYALRGTACVCVPVGMVIDTAMNCGWRAPRRAFNAACLNRDLCPSSDETYNCCPYFFPCANECLIIANDEDAN